MSNDKVLTKNIAKQFLEDEDSAVDLDEFTAIEDAAAKSLSKYEGDLYLDGLTSLSDAAAKSLSKHEGDLNLDGLTSLSDAAAKSLSKHEGDLSLDLDDIPESAASILRQHPSFAEEEEEDETETIEYTREDKPVLGLIETELKRVLDRKANPPIQELVGDRRFETNLNLTHYSNDKEIEGQPEVLLIHYNLGVETIKGDDKKWDELWNRITDRFYGDDEEVGALFDIYEAIEYLNEIDHDGFSGSNFSGFRSMMSAHFASKDCYISKDEKTAERLASRPRAVSDDGPLYVVPEGFNLASKSVSEAIKATIALYAAQNNLPSVDPDKIDDRDVIFELLDRNDPVTLTCRKAFNLTFHAAEIPEPVFITVGNAIEFYEELLADREDSDLVDLQSE